MENHEDELSLRDIVIIISRKKYWIISAVVIALLMAIAYLSITPSTYRSDAILNVNPVQVRAELENKIQLQPAASLSPDALKSLILSRAVFVKTAKALIAAGKLPTGLGKLPPPALADKLREQSGLSITPAKVSMDKEQALVVDLKTTAESPATAAFVANAWAKEAAAVINSLPVMQIKASMEALDGQLSPTSKAYSAAQKAWEDFQRDTPLEKWKEELASRTEQQVNIQTEIERLTQLIKEKEAQRNALSDEAANQQKIVRGQASPASISFSNRSLKEVLAALQKSYASSERLYQQKASELESYTAATPIKLWKEQLGKYRSRLAAIDLRLSSISSEIAVATAKLTATKSQLAGTPELLTLKREVTSDPLTAAVVSKDLEALSGLTLQNEAVSDVHTTLANRAHDLETSLAALAQERDSLKTERGRIEGLVAELRGKIAAADNKLAKLSLDASLAKSQYAAAAKLYSSYQNLRGSYYFENSNPTYIDLKTKAINLDIELAQLRSRLSGLKEQQAYTDQRAGELRRKLAVADTAAANLSENLKLAKEAFVALKQKYTDLKIELASLQNGQAQIISPAYEDPKPVSPKRMLTLAISLLLGGMAGLMLAFLSAALEDPEEKQPRQSSLEA